MPNGEFRAYAEQPRPLWTDCSQILYVGSGGRCDHWC